jgi:hypothetical protein
MNLPFAARQRIGRLFPREVLGLATRDSPDHVELVVRLSGFDLGFEIPASELAAFFDRTRDLAKAASVDGSNPQ